MPTNRTATLLLLTLLIAAFTLVGCGSQGSTDTAYWNGGGSDIPSGYTVSGKIISPVTLAPIQGMKCTLQAIDGTKAAGVAYTTTTDDQGNYSFAGMEAGSYRMTTAKEGNITDNSYFTVSQNMTVNQTSVKKDEWTAVMGADHPYDASMAYVSAVVDHTGGGTPPVRGTASSKDPGKDGVVVDLFSASKGKGSGYQARCYMDAQGNADWNATSTSSTGVALFYKAAPTDTYTMTASRANHAFDDVTGIAPVKGEFTNYMMNGKTSSGKPLSGLCFGPFINGSPEDPNFTVDENLITALINKVKNYTNGLRSYTSTKGMERFPEIAKNIDPNLTVVACAWFDKSMTDPSANQEIRNLIKAAKSKKVDIALVGSEATLAGASSAMVVKAINHVKDELYNPETGRTVCTVASGLAFNEAVNVINGKGYATDMGNACDVLFVHDYPMYKPGGISGTDDQGIRENLDWGFARFREAYGNDKQIIIGEIGYATAGDPPPPGSDGPYTDDKFSNEASAAHLKTVMSWANQNAIQYYYFEAFDEPWKRKYGEYEANFGIWDSFMNLKPGFEDIIK